MGVAVAAALVASHALNVARRALGIRLVHDFDHPPNAGDTLPRQPHVAEAAGLDEAQQLVVRDETGITARRVIPQRLRRARVRQRRFHAAVPPLWATQCQGTEQRPVL